MSTITSTAMVVGASRGLGRGIATALAQSGSRVIAVSRTASAPEERFGGGIVAEIADAADSAAPGQLLGRYEPQTLVLVAGATPDIRPLQDQTWETFSVNWHTDVRIAFHWLREALRKPLARGSRVIVISSGAALAGSPLSGGYAGAKATQRFITNYAREEADRAGLAISFTAVLPRLTPMTALGRPAVSAYAARSGVSEEEYLRRFGAPLTPEIAGAAIAELAATPAESLQAAYLLTGDGLAPAP